MGVSMKIPFAIFERYALIRKWNGTEYSFSAFKDEDDSAQLELLSERPNDERKRTASANLRSNQLLPGRQLPPRS